MSSYIPVTLEGANLKERHRYLNSLVARAYRENVPIESVISIPERSAVDRIFKIDLASKYKHVDYILENLKNDDMLFVSRSLKCLWLLETEYQSVINPSNLENVLYPEMIQPAVNKMKHWLQLNLKNAERCREFYNHYKDNIDYAIIFFRHCSQDFILSEFPNLVEKLSPVQVKILFEICPAACKLYFEVIATNRTALKRYADDENYFKCVRYLLKYDGNLFLDIVEKYFDMSRYNAFGPSVTKFVMKKYKNRILDRIELYATSILHLKTMALYVTSDEAKNIVLQLARAEFLDNWFSYQKVEPFMKQIANDERVILKKQVFVDKEIKDLVKEWPYPKPTPLNIEEEQEYSILTDTEHSPYQYTFYNSFPGRKMIKMKKSSRWYSECCQVKCVRKTSLDKLFDRYRFDGFEKTFNELTKNLFFEGALKGRLNIMLVLVSKTGGVSNQVEKLLKLLTERHRNEPNTLRAAVIRSLVKRECIWRVDDQVWDLLLQLGWDLGLDGSKAELVCREGLHAVVMRHLINDMPISPSLVTGFLECFSTLSEYNVNLTEKKMISKRLPQILFTLNANAFLDCLTDYKLSINDFPEAKPFLAKAAKDDPKLVCRLFEGKILRREIFQEVFALKQTNAMYVNALRHNTELLENGKFFSALISKERPNHDRFLYSLCTYFSEPGGLAEKHRIVLMEALEKNTNSGFVRPLCVLMPYPLLLNYLSKLCVEDLPKSKEQHVILSALKSNLHKSKPVFDINDADWRLVGFKTVANKVIICRKIDKERYLNKFLEQKETARISLRLAYNTSDYDNIYHQVCALNPPVALKVGLKLLFATDNIELPIWSALKNVIKNIKNISKKDNLLQKIEEPDSVAKNVEADYWALMYDIFMKINKKAAMPMLCRLENLLTEVDKNFIENVIKEFINFNLSPKEFSLAADDHKIRSLYFRIIAKYLFLCKTEDDQKYLLDNVCDHFFDAIEILFKKKENQNNLIHNLDEFILALKYTKAFIGDYVSCMPVFERILKRLHNILPVNENFEAYVNIHLTMLYNKAIKQAIEFKSDIFKNPNKCKEGLEIVGKVFGKFIGQEIEELMSRYFRSVVDLYKIVLYEYLSNYFEYSNTRNLLVTFIIKGILKAETSEAYLLVEHILQKEQYCIDEAHRKEFINVLKSSQNIEVQYYLNAHLLKNM